MANPPCWIFSPIEKTVEVYPVMFESLVKCVLRTSNMSLVTSFKMVNAFVLGSINRVSLSLFLSDVISETLTVRENLLFSANVRLPRSISRRERVERVNQVLKDLDLQSCAETLIGTDFTRGVSGGEKKRTTIGMELVLSPNVLFLDEPTTGLFLRCSSLNVFLFEGLDASTAQNVMNCLYQLSRQGRE